MAVTAVGVLGTFAGCTSYTGTPAHQVSEWASIADVASNDQLVLQDIAAVRLSVKENKLKYLTSNCSGLVFDAGTAYGNLPSPDNTLTNELNVAYEDFVSAGSSCAAARDLHSQRVAAALSKIDAGAAVLGEATHLLAADGVH
jgi:hypothetical protein